MSCAAALQLEAARHPTPPPLKEALAPRLPANPGTPGISGPSGGDSPGTPHISPVRIKISVLQLDWGFFGGSHAAFSTLSWGISLPKRSVF